MVNFHKTAKRIRLKDGRVVGYAEFGESEGKPLFHFHGFPGSRLEGILADKAAGSQGVRLIAVDRPGMGLSTFKPKRTILDWPDDVVELADALKIDQFAVEGISGGGPYSAACAYKIADRLTTVGILSGVGPFWIRKTRLLFPLLFKLSLWWSMGRRTSSIEQAEKFWLDFSKNLPEPDKKIILDSALRKTLALEFYEAFYQGSRGPIHDGKLYAEPWGFKLKDISSKVDVFLWHGELDKNVPISMGRAVAEAIPNCKAKFYPQEGHYSVAINHLTEIINTLSS